MLRNIYTASLTRGKAYDWLNHLSNQIGGRLSGSVQAQQAVDYTRKELEQLGLDKVWLQPVMVPKWVRGTAEFAYIESEPGITNNVPVCALGGSVATPAGGIKARRSASPTGGRRPPAGVAARLATIRGRRHRARRA